MNPLDFIREKFRLYYLENVDEIKAPTFVEKREFGFIPFRKEKTMIRHRGFESQKKLQDFIKTFVPSDAYYSSAYYQNPSEEKMSEKGWLGADLIFDLDCDHIQTSCKKEHDSWVCLDCGEVYNRSINKCLNCSSEKIDEEKWVCEECLNAAKKEVLKLLKIFEEDFGIPEKTIGIVFSGHRGYHIHLEHETLIKLGADERKEITDYVTGLGLKLSILQYLDVSKTGWSGRLARALYDLCLKKPEDLESLGLREKTIKKIVEKRDQILNLLSLGGEKEKVEKILGKSVWKEVFKEAFQEASVPVDTVVTTDVHRLIRLPHTLHGKTGLKVIPLTLEKLYEFDPLNDALAFPMDEKVRVRVRNAKKIKIGGEIYGPYKDDVINLPMPVALFYVCRGKAVPV